MRLSQSPPGLSSWAAQAIFCMDPTWCTQGTTIRVTTPSLHVCLQRLVWGVLRGFLHTVKARKTTA